MDPVPEAFYFVSLGVNGHRSPVIDGHQLCICNPTLPPEQGLRPKLSTLLCPPPFVFPLAPPVIFIGLKADFLKALTQGANICVPPSLWGRIHYNSSNPPLPTLYLFMCILGVKVNNVHLHQAFMQVHRHLKCEPPPSQKKRSSAK